MAIEVKSLLGQDSLYPVRISIPCDLKGYTQIKDWVDQTKIKCAVMARYSNMYAEPTSCVVYTTEEFAAMVALRWG